MEATKVKSASASPAEIAKKAAVLIDDAYVNAYDRNGWPDVDEVIVFVILSAIKEATQPLERELKNMFKRDREYGCGFYQDEKWHKHYMELARLIGFDYELENKDTVEAN